jgi:hypothetical protein
MVSPPDYYESLSEGDAMTMFDILAYLSQLMKALTAFTSHLALFLALVSQDGSVIMKGGVTHTERVCCSDYA